MARTPVLLIGCTLLMAASPGAAADPISPDDVMGPLRWGAARRVTHLRHLWFADQPDLEGLESARGTGIGVVINLRDPSEQDWDERGAVEGLGMQYHSVPIAGPSFDAAAIEQIETLVAEHRDDQVLLHCSSSNRVGGWLATHLVTRHGLEVDDALAVGRRAGITKPGIEARVRAYLDSIPEANKDAKKD